MLFANFMTFLNNSTTKMKSLTSINQILILIVTIISVSSCLAFDDIRYDPEQQEDGIPVISSRSLSPAIKMHYEDHNGDFEQPSTNSAQRRNSDADLDDGLEDDDEAEDRDEYKSGSVNHDSYENPSFGESRRAAKDGDDIENFFDKHLGPKDAIENREDNEIPISETPLKAAYGSDDDQYEAAASGPIAALFNSILQKRPLIITATTSPSSQDQQDSKTSASDEKQTKSTPSSTSDSIQDISGLPQVSYFAGHNYQAYEPAIASSSEQHSSEDDDYTPLREVYIGRKPIAGLPQTFLQQVDQPYQLYPVPASDQRLIYQSSNAHYREARGRPQVVHIGNQYPMRYPVAASYAYQKNQPEQIQQPAAEEEQTVTYGLSFGRNPEVEESDEPDTNAVTDEQSASTAKNAEEGPADYPPRQQLTGYSSMRSYSPTRHTMTPEQQRYYHLMMIQHQQRQQQQQQQQQQHQQQQIANAGAKYHKDPEESVVQPVSYVHYSSRSPSSNVPASSEPADTNFRKDDKDVSLRKKLLASLNTQIKVNPHYWQNGVTASASNSDIQTTRNWKHNPNMEATNNDYDTYNSYHSEVDPHKTLLKTSRLVGGVSDQQFEPKRFMGPSLESNTKSSQGSGNQLIDTASQALMGDLLRKNPVDQSNGLSSENTNSRVRRDDSEDRESEDADDDGVWVDDDEDDDNRQQSSDLNETSQEPEDESADENQQDQQQQYLGNPVSRAINPPLGIMSRPHGYDIMPDDLMVYPTSSV